MIIQNNLIQVFHDSKNCNSKKHMIKLLLFKSGSIAVMYSGKIAMQDTVLDVKYDMVKSTVSGSKILIIRHSSITTSSAIESLYLALNRYFNCSISIDRFLSNLEVKTSDILITTKNRTRFTINTDKCTVLLNDKETYDLSSDILKDIFNKTQIVPEKYLMNCEIFLRYLLC